MNMLNKILAAVVGFIFGIFGVPAIVYILTMLGSPDHYLVQSPDLLNPINFYSQLDFLKNVVILLPAIGLGMFLAYEGFTHTGQNAH
ncbi:MULTISPECIES: hypothetical protein [Vibrio]|uniref:Uncharacterized protein n=1 Tax=Vibrio algicola TaxID=2662262 RepID=A0A5Q0TJQ6_9VIBR|nr:MULTISPECIES: hypothetical protein [Vibrio]MBD1577209.1 hypothetical protein [Vibrio sp. S11_S32]